MNVTPLLLSIVTMALPLAALAQAPVPTSPLQPALPDPVAPPAAVTPAPLVPPPPAPSVPAGIAPKGGIMLNFQGASLPDVLNYLSEAAGFVIVQEAAVSGTVNIVSRQPITAEDAVDLLNSVLFEKGYTAIRNGRILKIVSRANAPRRDLPVEMGSDPERIPRKDEMVTQILPLRFGEAAKLIENLRPLLAESATISANEASNAILMTDTQTNIRRIAQIIRALDTSVASISGVHIFPMQFADAKGVATVLTQLFQSSQIGTTGGSGDRGRGGFRGFGGFPGGGRGDGAQPQASGQSEARQAASRVVAVADEQSNSVIISAPDELLPTIKDVIMQIDTSITDVTDTQIFRLQHADAVEMADIITNLYAEDNAQSGQRRGDTRGDRRGDGRDGRGGQTTAQQSTRSLLQAKVVAVGDPRTNSLVVTAAQGSMTQIAEMIGRLDATDAKKQRVFVHSLQHADVENVAAVLRGMLGQQTGSGVGAAQTGVSRLTERSASGAQMDAENVFNGGGAGGGRGGR
jgi:general secretion pathway protein D